MAFQVAEYSYELIESLEPLVRRIRARDKSLADQITRAASSIALNIAEGDVSDPGNQRPASSRRRAAPAKPARRCGSQSDGATFLPRTLSHPMRSSTASSPSSGSSLTGRPAPRRLAQAMCPWKCAHPTVRSPAQ